MVGLVVVGKVDRRARDDRQHVRHERLVALIELRAQLSALVERRARRRVQVHDAAAAIRRIVRERHADVRHVWTPRHPRRRLAQVDPAANRAVRGIAGGIAGDAAAAEGSDQASQGRCADANPRS